MKLVFRYSKQSGRRAISKKRRAKIRALLSKFPGDAEIRRIERNIYSIRMRTPVSGEMQLRVLNDKSGIRGHIYMATTILEVVLPGTTSSKPKLRVVEDTSAIDPWKDVLSRIPKGGIGHYITPEVLAMFTANSTQEDDSD